MGWFNEIAWQLSKINRSLKRIARALEGDEDEDEPSILFHYSVGPVTPKERKTYMPLEVSVTVEEQILVTVHPTTTQGNPAEIDGPIRVSVISGDGNFTLESDGKSYQAVSGDTPGDTTLLVEADGDLGEGVVLIQDTTVIHSLGANAANLGQEAGPITPKP